MVPQDLKRAAARLLIYSKDENGGDISSFISNGEWDLIGVYISEQNLFYVFQIFSLFQRNIS